jgi:subtilisin family serine protease
MSTPVAARGLGAAPLCQSTPPLAGVSPAPTDLAALPGLAELWAQTCGDPGICVAILDGPVDMRHPSLRGAKLKQVEALAASGLDRDIACDHGTHVASIIFGQPAGAGPVRGIASCCRGVSIPIFATGQGGRLQSCNQLDLARAIGQAVQHGAQIINISAGQFAPSGIAYPLLESVVRQCAGHDVLLVAAVGNEGCQCLHVPAALETVLAVGAMRAGGQPLSWSNWGGRYQIQGILAPGENILGARAGGGSMRASGTSYATAIVSGVAALLLSLQRKLEMRPSPHRVRAALLATALGCEHEPVVDCRRLLAGRMNIRGAISAITHEGMRAMSETLAMPVSALNDNHPSAAPPAAAQTVRPSEVQPAAGCACQCPQPTAAAPQLVYALGQLGYDLVNEARLDSLTQHITGHAGGTVSDRAAAFDPARVLDYLVANPSDAAAVEWTLILDGSPVYAIRPSGPFAAETYKLLRDSLKEQLAQGIDRVSIPGVIAGKATLLMGQVVPVIAPELRGMRSWTTRALIESVIGQPPRRNASQRDKDAYAAKEAGVRDFLDRVYHEHRNLGMMPQERALNFAATNAYQAERVYESALKEDMNLESITVTRSPICRPGSDCWDVELYFFYPKRQVQTVRKVYRLTVDVSDVVPVSIGPIRSWMTR